MRNFCASLCQTLVLCSLVACAGSHGLAPGGDGGIDANEMDGRTDAHFPDTGSYVDNNITDLSFTCPTSLPVWNDDTSCPHEGQVCSMGGDSVCGSAYRCTCESGNWSCLVAEPDPACWCGRYPDLDSPCTTEEQQCMSPVECDPSRPNLLCESGRWIVDPLNNELCAPSAACPVNSDALGSSCVFNGQRCMQGVCCTSAPGVPPHSYVSIICEDGVWVDEHLAFDCVEDPLPMCDEFACGDGLCRGDQVCVADCGPDDGVEHRCIVNDVESSCESIAAHLGRPASSCTYDAAGHATLANPSLCG